MAKQKKEPQNTGTIADTLVEIGRDVLQHNAAIDEVYVTATGMVFANEGDALDSVNECNDKTIIKVTR